MTQYNSGRKKRFGQRDITTDRYDYLGLEQAEPDLGDPKVGVGSTGANPKPAGRTFLLAAVEGYEGKRYWAPITGEGVEVQVQGTQGLQGLQGTQGGAAADGIDGDQGAQGIQGNQGLQGLQGNQGVKGDQGAQGLQGNQGLSNQGAQGVGSQGNQGLQGIQGLQGVQGTGGQGTQGLGVQGSQGIQGNQGNQGVNGEQGAQGLQGLQGHVGKAANWERKTGSYTMSDGDQIIADTSGGSFTLTLPANPSGGEIVRIADGGDWTQNNLTIDRNGSAIEGFSENLTVDIGNTILDVIYESDGVNSTWQVYSSLGAQGLSGDQGAQGLQGSQGLSHQGSQGNQGAQGLGSQGNQGLQGLQGNQGVKGDQGAQGLQGLQGLQGNQGTKGNFTSLTYALLDPLDTSLEMDYVSLTSTGSVTNMDNLDNQDTDIFLFDQDPSGGTRYISTGNRKIYLKEVYTIYVSIARGGAVSGQWGDTPESTEPLYFEYSHDNSTWSYFYQDPNALSGSFDAFVSTFSDDGWVEFELDVPAAAKTYNGVHLRFRQENADGTGDNWAISSVLAQVGGDQGVQGLQGNQGVKGDQGAQGLQGLQGTQGNQGIQGLQGPISDFQGTQGNQGTQANQGLQGNAHQGNQGNQGVQASTILTQEGVFEIMLFT